MKKTVMTVLVAFAATTFAEYQPPKDLTPKEKSLHYIQDKSMSLVMLVDARLKGLLDLIKIKKMMSNEQVNEYWDLMSSIKILYKERKLDILKAYHQHYRIFGRGEVETVQEIRITKKINEYMQRAEDFWLDVKIVRSQLPVLRFTTQRFDMIEPITELGPSLSRQVIKESDRIEKDEIVD